MMGAERSNRGSLRMQERMLAVMIVVKLQGNGKWERR